MFSMTHYPKPLGQWLPANNIIFVRTCQPEFYEHPSLHTVTKQIPYSTSCYFMNIPHPPPQ